MHTHTHTHTPKTQRVIRRHFFHCQGLQNKVRVGVSIGEILKINWKHLHESDSQPFFLWVLSCMQKHPCRLSAECVFIGVCCLLGALYI